MREIKFIGSFNVGDEVELEVYAEECCELCGETTNGRYMGSFCPILKLKNKYYGF